MLDLLDLLLDVLHDRRETKRKEKKIIKKRDKKWTCFQTLPPLLALLLRFRLSMDCTDLCYLVRWNRRSEQVPSRQDRNRNRNRNRHIYMYVWYTEGESQASQTQQGKAYLKSTHALAVRKRIIEIINKRGKR